MLPGKRTNDGALYVTQGPPPAGTPLVGGIAVSHTGVIYVSQSFVQPFTPANLFTAGEQGAWYDPSDFSTMFQDSAGTTPVTAVGQPVGKILDKSGRNNHATQATAASRPVLRQDANSKYYLEFDGVDDSLATANINWGTANKSTVTVGQTLTSASPRGASWECGASNPGSFRSFYNLASASLTCRGNSGGMLISNAAATVTGNGVASVITGKFDISASVAADSISSRLNGSVIGSGDAVPGGGVFATLPLYMGINVGNSWNLACRIYCLIVRGALSTTQEITDTETWVAAKTGVTL